MIASEIEIAYDPGLVEAAVLAGVAARGVERSFRHERDALYEVADAETREDAFRSLHARWLLRLGLDAPFRQALDELPEIGRRCARCLVARATRASDEAADLRMLPAGPPTILVLIRPETFVAPECLLGFLRRELLHVADMLDPRFGYVPDSLGGGGLPHGTLLQSRYRTLWDTFVDGRLVRRGHAPDSVRADRLRKFRRVFPAVGDRVDVEFERFFGTDGLRHADLVAFVRCDGAAGACCPLCQLPAGAFETAPERLPRDLIAAISADFPAWAPTTGLCRRCAELYSVRLPARQRGEP